MYAVVSDMWWFCIASLACPPQSSLWGASEVCLSRLSSLLGDVTDEALNFDSSTHYHLTVPRTGTLLLPEAVHVGCLENEVSLCSSFVCPVCLYLPFVLPPQAIHLIHPDNALYAYTLLHHLLRQPRPPRSRRCSLHPNITADAQGFAETSVKEPDARGTWAIVCGTSTSLFLYAWASLHLNIPRTDETWREMIWRFVKWGLLSFLVPEFVIFIALLQWYREIGRASCRERVF